MNPIPRLLVALCALFFLTLPAAAESGGLPPMPEPVTSFGATIDGGWLYVYGGNTGKAHEFNKECVKGDFFRLQMPSGKTWESLPGGLSLLSCSLVTYEGKVIRIGGMTARNEKGAKDDLLSTDEVMRFDPATGKWELLTPLPQPRSSGDAAILDHTIYVGGGWNLSGKGGGGANTHWYDTLLTFDLKAPEKGWQSQSQPFQRRALAAVAHAGRIWFIGGIDNHDELARNVDWFDPATGEWGKGPDLPDDTMAGFGVAACEQGGKLYATPFSGKVLALSADGQQWQEVTKLNPPRFFHRLLPLPDGRLAAVGGSNHQGHVGELELISLEAKTSAAAPAASSAPADPPVAKGASTGASVQQPSEPGGAAWPQWRGPNRDGIAPETGWRKDWPADGPPKLWSVQVGMGLSAPVVADGRLIAQGNDGNGTDTIFAFDAATGNELWHFSLPCKSNAYGMEIVPNGPAATPTISGGRVFALTREGDFVCLDVSNGKLAWQKHLKDIGGRRPVYGYAQSPLVADGRVFLDIGAKPGRVGSTAALDATTGELKWKAGSGEAGYSSARMFERDGHQFVVMLKGEALDVFDPADGHVLWSYHITGRDYTNSLTPVFVGHRILVSNSSEPFARLLDWDLAAEPNVRVAWKNQQFALLFNNPILYRDCLFAFNEKRRSVTEFTCLNAETGEAHWVTDTVPIGTFILSDDHWIFLTREGEVVLAPASVTELKPAARFKALDGKCYATPTLANGRLFVRDNAGTLNAYDLRVPGR
ncbi:Kelch repeat-containing protein [Chthoniobacter flavus Ellin428]|uniref:Kelch repeat-containing protein n=1 Tax=Chthoniobacter flavus Ellin428 TaxID=497964 RepID=B4CYL9_9BACT|nr:PQQ-binding-like beta-propeller repeat protein [Chthoniobacter flavus]EDY20560.1 Kelch repeat-containing protein [Chthoniobacter flavus Ellin428]TCO89927.1 outer membrane protein assembly factor BamB [Chthoniobacter flavus]